MVLVATPARLSTPRALLARVESLVHGLRWPGSMEWRLYLNEQPRSIGTKYAPNAAARNQLIERYLKAWHQWVLWIDADIIELPENLLKVLVDVAQRRGGNAIVAPMVWVERVAEGPPTVPVGGWFYDTGGFVDAGGRFADFANGVAGEGNEVEMQSVGCVYLAPAALYRHGLRYAPVGDEVEHLSFMRAARAAGATVWATRQANVIHAYLPKWGETWHHREAV